MQRLKGLYSGKSRDTAMTTKILVATNPAGFSRISRAIKNDYSVQGVFTLQNAQNALSNNQFDATIMTLKFDGSKMPELLRWMKFQRNFSHMPIICVKQMNTDPDFFKDDIHLAKSLIGPHNYIDLDHAQTLQKPDQAILDALKRGLTLSTPS